MRHVTFTRDMAPQHRGDRRVVPDEIAALLEAEGAIEPNPPSWPQIVHRDPAPAKAPAAPPRRPKFLTKERPHGDALV